MARTRSGKRHRGEAQEEEIQEANTMDSVEDPDFHEDDEDFVADFEEEAPEDLVDVPEQQQQPLPQSLIRWRGRPRWRRRRKKHDPSELPSRRSIDSIFLAGKRHRDEAQEEEIQEENTMDSVEDLDFREEDEDFVADFEEEEVAEDLVEDPTEYPEQQRRRPPPQAMIRWRGRPRWGWRHKKHDPPLMWEVLEEKNERWIDEHIGKEEEEDSRGTGTTTVERVEPSADVILPLLRFQKEWLAWALKQEESCYKGGILADEMGMGKTIQAISLVLTAKALTKDLGELCVLPPSSEDIPSVKCTLVICPVVAVIQWAGEIQRYTREGSVRALLYHGAKRSSFAQDFSSYDFVITTYSTVEVDYRKNMMAPKEKCVYCGQRFYPSRMKVHLMYYCGPHAVKTKKQAKQVSRKKKNHLKMSSVEGDAELDISGAKGKDGSEELKGKWGQMSKTSSKKDNHLVSNVLVKKSPLHSVKWERIILDEAHSIKSRNSNTTRAVCSLQSCYKWALSGTPLQNRVSELYSLVRFLQVQPYSFFFCRDCDCKTLDHPNKRCTSCNHASSRHFCWWNKYITNPVQILKYSDDGKRALLFLRGKLLKSLVLRRTKKGRAADIALPPRFIFLRRDSLDKNEHEFYEALYTQSQIQFDSYLDAGTLMNNYAHIFDLLTRLRQAVDHPYLVVYSKNVELSNRSNDNLPDICGICHDPPEDPVDTSCEHVFCKSCFLEYSAVLGSVSCPSCSKPVTIDLTTKPAVKEQCSDAAVKGFKHSILRKVNLQEFKMSTKIDALEEIRNMIEGDLSAKGIVFSQFTSFLELIGYSLHQSGVKFVQLVGSMSIAEREKAIQAFTYDADCKLFLMSLKAGGVALNLTAASHVFLMDPWWNPAVEHQAQDRIHRIGQYKPIRVVRFVIKDTIEERILKLQEKKELMFEGTIGDSSTAMSKLTEADLRFLFHN